MSMHWVTLDIRQLLLGEPGKGGLFPEWALSPILKRLYSQALKVIFFCQQLWICVACLASSLAAPAPSQGPQLYLDIVDMAAISRMTPQQLEALAEGLAAEEIMRWVHK